MRRSGFVTLNFFQGPFLHPRHASPQWMLKQVQHDGRPDHA
jgi:hypothetical protein